MIDNGVLASRVLVCVKINWSQIRATRPWSNHGTRCASDSRRVQSVNGTRSCCCSAVAGHPSDDRSGKGRSLFFREHVCFSHVSSSSGRLWKDTAVVVAVLQSWFLLLKTTVSDEVHFRSISYCFRYVSTWERDTILNTAENSVPATNPIAKSTVEQNVIVSDPNLPYRTHCRKWRQFL